jgi:hypothetical protein
MWNFLSFETFITQDILIIVYYIGLFFSPLLLWIFRKKAKNILKSDNRVLIFIILFTIFLIMQLMWRMMFEAMIGYFDIHNYLQIIANEKL